MSRLKKSDRLSVKYTEITELGDYANKIFHYLGSDDVYYYYQASKLLLKKSGLMYCPNWVKFDRVTIVPKKGEAKISLPKKVQAKYALLKLKGEI